MSGESLSIKFLACSLSRMPPVTGSTGDAGDIKSDKTQILPLSYWITHGREESQVKAPSRSNPSGAKET